MKAIRAAVATTVTVLTLPGYALSQYVYWRGDTGKYVKALDASTLPVLATVVLLGVAVLVAMDKEAGEQ